MTCHVRTITLAAAMALSLVACGSEPPRPDEVAAEVTRLDAVIPIIEELQVTDFENSPYCQNLGYARGAFGHLDQDGCARDGTGEFDAAALADHGRLAEAIELAGVATSRILDATYEDGALTSAWFKLDDASVTDDWQYLYDPTGVVPKENEPGRTEFARVDQDWWVVRSFDD